MPRTKTAAAAYKKLMLRLPEDVLQACTQLAEANHRSMNAQIVHVLTQWLKQEKDHQHVRSQHAQSRNAAFNVS